jgi:hypothetical protein
MTPGPPETIDRKSRHRKPQQVHEDIVTVRGCPTLLRQIAVRGLGHDHPTLILTNDFDAKAGWLVNCYAKRMAIELRLAEAIRSFHLDADSSSVALNVDLYATLTVWAHATYDTFRSAANSPGLPAQPRHHLAPVRLHPRPAHHRPPRHRRTAQQPHLLPVLRTAKIPPTPIPGGTTAPSPSRSNHPTRHRGRFPVRVESSQGAFRADRQRLSAGSSTGSW